MKPGPILFMDIATHTGWCRGTPGEKPVFGSFRVSEEGDNADKFAGAFKWVATHCQAFKPQAFFFEAALTRNGKTAVQLMGIAAAAQAAARLCGVWKIEAANVSSVRAFFLPKGSPRSGDAVKRAVVDHCRNGFRIDVKNDDEADAVAGWLWACNRLFPHIKPYAGELFAKDVFTNSKGLPQAKEEPRPANGANGVWGGDF